ncbi:Zn-ribbon domain-containing OB-fold protein [Actinomadura flavalba]|uniref:Zn-ribbon domain-containing OB-fold protein n=1 Tax=Actinomadura flavalba TaxID=1120938 RepID=UPI00036B561F|nr:OB-fold domain-containing protein [Actinomadura flavalba]
MDATKERRPAVDGWFTPAPDVRLLGTRCTACGTPYFPRNDLACRNPACEGPRDGSELTEHTLSATGRVWSFADARYRPPPPSVSPEPFRPYIVAAVELDAERMVVLGRVAPDVSLDDLAVGQTVELTEGVLYEDDTTAYTVWMWRPLP